MCGNGLIRLVLAAQKTATASSAEAEVTPSWSH
jgi:hypothetical protein